MKIIILILIMIFASGKSHSQIVTDTALNKFVGTWRWVSSTDTVTIILQKQTTTLPSGTSNEVLVGWHKYVQNGQVIQSSLQYVGANFDNENIPIGNDLQITIFGFSKSSTKIWFTRFWDLVTHKKNTLSFELLPNSTTKARWKLIGSSQIPSDLILTKQ